jgi:hypothetical protein
LSGGVRAICRWLANFAVCEAHFAAAHFQNLNTPEDLRAAGVMTTDQAPAAAPGV